MNKKFQVIVFCLVVILAILAFQYFNKNSKSSTVPAKTLVAKQTPPPILPNYKITQAPIGGLPDQFPKDFPLEKGVQVDNGYNVVNTDSVQSTVHFESKNSLDKIFSTYSTYLSKKNGWTVLTTLNNPTVKSISAQNSQGTSVVVSMAQNTVTKVNQITISFVYKK